MAGIRIDPSAATSATADPLISAKKSEALIVTIARPPRMKPTNAEAKLINRVLIPDAFMIAPAKMKSGIAMSGKDVDPLYITRPTLGSEPIPPGPVIMASTATAPREIAIGIPRTTNNSNTRPIPSRLMRRPQSSPAHQLRPSPHTRTPRQAQRLAPSAHLAATTIARR